MLFELKLNIILYFPSPTAVIGYIRLYFYSSKSSLMLFNAIFLLACIDLFVLVLYMNTCTITAQHVCI